MASFDGMLQDLVNKDDEFKIKLAVDCFVELLPTLKHFDPEHNGMMLTYTILGAAVIADGVLTQKEFALVSGLLAAIGEEASESEIMDWIQTCADNSEGAYDILRELKDNLNDEGVNTLANFIAATCSIDDKIAAPEVAMIRDIIE
ncbi:MAG: TerB family tellurite resistance protein [Lachnospiraceae bacterium]|nr:TerB family tellurite resistance protein [Lachnospiraceae bacterium]